jgi:hypothetical protein
LIKIPSTIFGVKSRHQLANLPIVVCSTLEEQSTHDHKVKGSNPAAAGTEREKIMEQFPQPLKKITFTVPQKIISAT